MTKNLQSKLAKAISNKTSIPNEEALAIIKEAMQDEITIVWNTEDVATLTEDEDLTVEQRRDILKTVEDDFDAYVGVSWCQLQEAAENYLGKAL